MKLTLPKLQLVLIVFALTSFSSQAVKAQYLLNNDSAFKAGAPNSGRIWGYAFGDFAYKGHSDSLNRGGKAQYTGIPTSRTTFQFRRIYFGYDYNISKKFSAEFLLASEDNFPAGNPPSSGAASGDLLSNTKLAFYIKYMNISWKDIWKGTDLIVGQMQTPSFPLSTEKLWAYRSIERTITDLYGGTPSYDMGAALRGTFDPKTKNYGYDLMVGNGSKAVPENDNFKWFYGDVWAKFFDQRLYVNLYSDYERLNWTTSWHHARNMVKAVVGYTTPGFTLGAEAYITSLTHEVFATKISGGTDTLTSLAKGLSIFSRGSFVTNQLGYFIRVDLTSPTNKINNSMYSKYAGNIAGFTDAVDKTTFFTVGLDYSPAKNVHFMPNLWYNHYASLLPTAVGSAAGDHDLVYRLTFFYTFGK